MATELKENNVALREITALWLESRKEFVKGSTYVVYEACVRRHILPRFGRKKTLSEKELQDFVNEKLDSGMSLKSVKDILAVIRMILKFGAKKGLCGYVPTDIVFPAGRKADFDVLSVANQRKIMEYAKNSMSFRNLGIYICLSTGMRIGEICALKFGDINAKEGVIHIRRTLQRLMISGGHGTELVFGFPKTVNSFRDIPMGRDLLSILKPLCRVLSPDNFLLSNDVTPVEPRTMRRYFASLLKKLDVPDIKFHGLRHSFATRCIESNCDYKTVSSILGHSDIKTTLNLYVHPNFEQKKKCLDKMLSQLKRK